MKIAILGTRGIPNNYGGFEQCAEKLGLWFVRKGHDVTQYNPYDHPYKDNCFNGIKIKHIFSNEKRLGHLGTFIYDYLSLKDAIKEDYDIILELGYSPCSLYYYLKDKRGAKIVTNMDGFELERRKWGRVARGILKYSERLAVEKSDALVADNPNIREYILKKYGRESHFIPYGAELFNSPQDGVLENYGLEKNDYYALVARLEPENSVETIIDGYILSKAPEPFVVIGSNSTKYGEFIKNKYKNCNNIKFLGGLYKYDGLSTLRWYSKLYFHGHSVGGTNPSLLEAMASNAYIAAHDNPFNKFVLGQDAYYFSNLSDIIDIIEYQNGYNKERFVKNNRLKIENIYNWEKVAEEYLKQFNKTIKG